MEKLFIIAGNYDQFRAWRSNHINLIGETLILKQNLIYVHDVHNLRGYREPHGLFIGTWYQRADIESIILQLQVAGSITPARAQELLNMKSI